jgi:hypothetical protein
MNAKDAKDREGSQRKNIIIKKRGHRGHGGKTRENKEILSRTSEVEVEDDVTVAYDGDQSGAEVANQIITSLWQPM